MPVPQTPNHYHTLRVPPSAGEEDIKRAYRALAKKFHPDRVPAEQQERARIAMAGINAAYEVLSDPARRAQFDKQQGYATRLAVPRWHTQRARERSRRGQIERQRVITLTGAALLGLALLAALARFRWLGLENTAARCAWAIALAVGTLLVLAALRLTEL